MSGDNKTEQATPRRRQKAREKGQVLRSREVASSLALSACLLSGLWQARGALSAWQRIWRASLAEATSPGRMAEKTWEAAGFAMLGWVTPLLLFTWLVAVGSTLAQGGLVVAPSALVPDIKRLSPASKLGQLFSAAGLAQMLKSLLPVVAMALIAWAIMAREWQGVLHCGHLAATALIRFILEKGAGIAWRCGLVLLLWSGFDYGLQRTRFEHDLRMSRQDIRDEVKETEGNPAVRIRIRQLQRQVRRRRMLQQVSKAAVVITNPNEFAVALEYRLELAAPMVVAKGRNRLAQEIKQIARWHGIPLMENPPLAHALYRSVEVGQSIPPKLYAVVAEVLAVIYRARAQARRN